MGSGIAEASARSGCGVIVRVLDETHLKAGRSRIEDSLGRAVTQGRLDAAERDAVLQRISLTADPSDLQAADLVVEAVPERLESKRQVFAELQSVCRPDAILATNTSSLPVIELAAVSARPEQVVGLHFFNPAPVMRLVELVETVATAPDVLAGARRFAESLGKTVVACRDRAGFIANLLLFPYLNEAVELLDSGHATREDIDAAMRLGAGHPMGPLELVDLIGLDACMQVLESLHHQFADTRYVPSPVFRQLVTAGFTGRKAGRGIYSYAEDGASQRDGRPGHDLPAAEAEVTRMGVVGTGVVASGMVEVAARAGLEVVCWGRSEESIGRARAAVDRSTGRAMEKGKLSAEDRDGLLGRISLTTELADLGPCEVVVEAVAEDLEIKKGIFRDLAAATPETTILATATSSLPVIDLAAETGRIDRVLGIHFFNPVPVMKLVELVPTVATAGSVLSTAVALVERLGKSWVLCRDRSGFIVNRLLFPYLNDAVRMVEEGYATTEDIDVAMTLGCNHPIGPLALVDLVGLDVTLSIVRSLHAELREPGYAPAPLLEHMVRAGFLGKKSGRGFRTAG
ncbi:MAG: 3-hydroxybutyryl-CoA dehydrogenase [Actinomycetota bacterium]|nr:3-hydroxybutyryl-CoA dehydrogenase [Actinomycetota bacterium]